MEKPKSKVEKSKIAKSQKSKIGIFGFGEKDRKAKNPRARASLFDGYRRGKRGLPLDGISIPPLTYHICFKDIDIQRAEGFPLHLVECV